MRVFRRCRGVLGSGGESKGCISCQIRLRLRKKVDECKPLPSPPVLSMAAARVGAHAPVRRVRGGAERAARSAAAAR